MSFQERRSLYNLIWGTVVSVVFFIFIYNMYNNGRFDTTDMAKFWGLVLLIYIGVSIVTRIIGMILYRIIGEISDEIKGEKLDDRDIVDERDKLIELKSERTANIFFMFAMVLGCFLLVFNYSISAFFISIIVGGFIGEIAQYALQIMYYRRGV